jgi:HTH-type transcriptional regulator/antitoxin HigA
VSQIGAITTKADYEVALARAAALMDAKGGTPEADELDVLASLIEAYEDKHYPMPMGSDPSPPRMRE